MAIIEFFPSRHMHITREATTLTQILKMSNVDWDAGGDATFGSLPVIGLPFAVDAEDLRCTDIRNRWVSNTLCEATYTYSTRGLPHINNIPDTLSSSSWDFETSFTPQNEDEFIILGSTSDAGSTGDPVSWKEFYETEKGVDLGDQDAPSRYPQGSIITFNVKQNVTEFNWMDIADNIGKTNAFDFFGVWVLQRTEWPEHDRWIDISDSGNDSGRWLFAGFRGNSTGSENVEIDYTFLYNPIYLWNAPYGLITGEYDNFNFHSLPFALNPDDFRSVGLRG